MIDQPFSPAIGRGRITTLSLRNNRGSRRLPIGVPLGAARPGCGYAAIYVAIKQGYVASAGLNVEHIKSQSGPAARNQLPLSAGQFSPPPRFERPLWR